ncbi:MAG: strawberry notch family protein [Bacteroidales bacterium]|nr:strawberry notch family protein [Bacteroidales bacterium]
MIQSITQPYTPACEGISTLGAVVPAQLAEDTNKSLKKMKDALGGEVAEYVCSRLRMSRQELQIALAAEQVDGVALAMYNIECRSQSIVLGDATGIGKGRQAAAMIRYGMLAGYLPIFFTDRYTLFSDMYRDCKVLGIKDSRPLIINSGVTVVDFDIETKLKDSTPDNTDEIWSPKEDENGDFQDDELMSLYERQYEVVYRSPKNKVMDVYYQKQDIPSDLYEYIMITYSQLKDARRDRKRLDFLMSICEKHRVLFIFDEAHRSSSVSAGKVSIITQAINSILENCPKTQCVFFSATFAKRPESFITFMRRTALSELATEDTLRTALHNGGMPMQEFVSASLVSEGQMLRREHSNIGIPDPVYTYLEAELPVHSEKFDKVMYFFREIVKLNTMVQQFKTAAEAAGSATFGLLFKVYPTRAQLFYINKVLLMSLKASQVAAAAVRDVQAGRCVVIGMSDTLECILRDVDTSDGESVRGDISQLLCRLLEKTIRSTANNTITPIYEWTIDIDNDNLVSLQQEIKVYYEMVLSGIHSEIYSIPMSPIDVIRQLITQETFTYYDGNTINIRFEECTGRAHQLEYLSPEGDDDYLHASICPRKKRHSNLIFNDFQNNKIDVILINACGAIGASAHAIETNEVSAEQVRQRKMLIVQNDLDVNIDLQKRGRINRTGQRKDLPPLYEYIITAIPSEKRLNMMLRAKLRSLSANTTASQDQDKAQADFLDINNKYGNEVATNYIIDHEELAFVLGLKGNVSASMLMARIAMLSVTAQQEIVDEILNAYINLEAELRRINQWDLEREYRDFEAQFVSDELFTTAKSNSKFGSCSYLSTYKCKQKTFPMDSKAIAESIQEARLRFGPMYKDNLNLQHNIKQYYANKVKVTKQNIELRKSLLTANIRKAIQKIIGNEEFTDELIVTAQTMKPQNVFLIENKLTNFSKASAIVRKLTSFSTEYDALNTREKKELKNLSEQKMRLEKVLDVVRIGDMFFDVSNYVSSDLDYNRVMAVLIDVRFGKDEDKKFLPSNVEFVFALSAVTTQLTVNLVHNEKWSNYDRLMQIISGDMKDFHLVNPEEWDKSIALNNNRIVNRRIITGNILGAYVHPKIEKLKPRFITFSLAPDENGKKHNMHGLLLPNDEESIRQIMNYVIIPLEEGIKYATSVNSVYQISGVGVKFSILQSRPTQSSDIHYIISVDDKDSKLFENDSRFDTIRHLFKSISIRSIYDYNQDDAKEKKRPVRFRTSILNFDSEDFQKIVRFLAQMDAMIIIPRGDITIGDMHEFRSRSERDDSTEWQVLDWKNSNSIIPPDRQSVLAHISAPIVDSKQRGASVCKYSEIVSIARQILPLNGKSLKSQTNVMLLKNIYQQLSKCNDYGRWSFYEKEMMSVLVKRILISSQVENKIDFGNEYELVIRIIESEYLDPISELLERYESDFHFLAPDVEEVRAFLYTFPSMSEDYRIMRIRSALERYIDGKSDIID